MSIVEIRTNDGVLLIARPGRLPAAVMRAGDRQSLQARLRRLPADVRALDQVRRMWRSLGMSISATTLDDDELARALSRRISSGLAEAVFLRDGLTVGMAKVDIPAPSPVLHVQLPGMTVLIAGKGQLPGEFQGQSNPAQAAQILRQIQHASPQAKTIDNHAHRLPGGTTNTTKAAPLRQHIAHQLERGSYDAVVLTNPGTISQAAARPEAPKPVSAMTSEERIGEALRLSLPYALKAGGEELKKALEDMLDPRNIGLMIAMAAGVALANLNPISAVVVDSALLALAWWNGGSEAIAGITDFAMATLDARDATDEAELDKAAQAYGAALGKMGPKLLAALFSKLKKSKGGTGDKGRDGAKASAASNPKAPNKTGRQAGGETSGGSSAAQPFPKKAVRFGQRSKSSEPGAIRADGKTLREIRRAKTRENTTLKKDGWPDIPGRDVKTFKSYPEPVELKEGQKIYRVIDSESNPNGAYWTTQNPAAMSEAQWRSGAAVKGEWNGDGAYVEYTVPKGGMKVWSGEAAPQMSSDGKSVLSGGGNQLWVAQDKLSATSVSRDDAISTGWSQ